MALAGLDHAGALYIGGDWVLPAGERTEDVVNPATEEVFASLRVGADGGLRRRVGGRPARPSRRGLGRGCPGAERSATSLRMLDVLTGEREELIELV